MRQAERRAAGTQAVNAAQDGAAPPPPPPRAQCRSGRAEPRRCRAVMSHSQGRGAARGSGAAGAERSANMAGVSDAAAPGSGGEGRRGGGGSSPEQLQQDGCRGEPKTLWGSSELRPPPAGPGQPSPHQRTETLGFYESDRGRKKKRGLSGEERGGAGGEVPGLGPTPAGRTPERVPGRAVPAGRASGGL